MPLTTVFLDIDGVIVDAVKLPQEYVRLMGDILAPALGGRPEDWGRANAIVFPRVWEELKDSADDPAEAERIIGVANVRGMAKHLGIDPPDETTCLRLTDDFDRYVRDHGDFFFAGSAEVIRTLAAKYRVHTASGNNSWAIEAMLRRLGVADLVGYKFGRDLVNALKGGPDYYPRIFAATDIDPADAVFVDDHIEVLALAAELGAATVLVEAEPSDTDHPVDAVITSIGQLPAAIRTL